MNNNRKFLKLQENIVLNNAKKYKEDYWLNLIHKKNLHPILEKTSKLYRKRIYTQEKTLSMFLTQSINKDASCQKIVSSRSLSQRICSTSTGAYCKARKRLNSSKLKGTRQIIFYKNRPFN